MEHAMTRKTRLQLLYFRTLLVLGSLVTLIAATGAGDWVD